MTVASYECSPNTRDVNASDVASDDVTNGDLAAKMTATTSTLPVYRSTMVLSTSSRNVITNDNNVGDNQCKTSIQTDQSTNVDSKMDANGIICDATRETTKDTNPANIDFGKEPGINGLSFIN